MVQQRPSPCSERKDSIHVTKSSRQLNVRFHACNEHIVVFSTLVLVLKPSLSQAFPMAIYPLLRLISWNFDQSLFDSHWWW